MSGDRDSGPLKSSIIIIYTSCVKFGSTPDSISDVTASSSPLALALSSCRPYGVCVCTCVCVFVFIRVHVHSMRLCVVIHVYKLIAHGNFDSYNL